MTEIVLAFHQVAKRYGGTNGDGFLALHELSFTLPAGRKVAIVGRSGSGKSTLLHLAAGIDLPSAGRIELYGRDLSTLSDRERTLLRREEIGLVFQFFHLLSHLSLRDNVALPSIIAGEKPAVYARRAEELLERVGLGARARDRVQSLSGGEMQRVAICRALMRRPRLLLADEPTGSLDDATGRAVMELMLELASEQSGALLYVTHSPEMAALADEIWELHSGVLTRP